MVLNVPLCGVTASQQVCVSDETGVQLWRAARTHSAPDCYLSGSSGESNVASFTLTANVGCITLTAGAPICLAVLVSPTVAAWRCSGPEAWLAEASVTSSFARYACRLEFFKCNNQKHTTACICRMTKTWRVFVSKTMQ